MPNGAIAFRQLSEYPADAIHAERRDAASPNPGPRPKPPNQHSVPKPLIVTSAPEPKLEQPHDLPLGQPRGYIQNDWGDICWYKQTTIQRIQYFQTIPNKTATLILDKSSCMKNGALAQDGNKMLINNSISRPYSHPDAKFLTRVDELYKTKLFQLRGQCIQSATYSIIGVIVEYHEANDSIYMVKHAPSAGHCSNQPVTKFD